MSQRDADVKNQAPVEENASGPNQTDATAGVPAEAAELQQLRVALKEKEEEAAQSQDRFVRERAELENFKKRMAREKGESLRFAAEPLIREILPVVDNLERAIAHEQDSESALIQGVRLVLDSMLEVLERHGVTRIDARGAQFDPAVHEAMAQVESAEHEPNQVVEQHQIGYRLHERLLRPARVTVNARKRAPNLANEHDSD
jgi:molecular chaperone GrpE